MPSTGTRKKKSTAGRKTTRKKTPSAKKRQKQAYNRELVTEITILITLAVSVLLVISNFDIGEIGSEGEANHSGHCYF